MEYKLKSGKTITDAEIEELAAAAERGEYPGKPGEWIVRPQGRPKLCDEELVTIAFKIPRSQRDSLDRAAASKNETRSQFMRSLLTAALAAM
ncbi:MAG: hypothetical protein IJJ14_05035 [Coriobacteriales bacterium]|nr:hypothetical protein [Coriobacteriales bacterium]